MSNFTGGSAFAMARDIAEGYVLVTERTFRRFTPAEVKKLQFEIDRHLRELRGSQNPTDPNPVVQARNRKISRLNSALIVARGFQQRVRR